MTITKKDDEHPPIDKPAAEKARKENDSDDEDIDLLAVFKAQQERTRPQHAIILGQEDNRKQSKPVATNFPQKQKAHETDETTKPAKKKAKTNPSNVHQSSLFSFFSSSSTRATKEPAKAKKPESLEETREVRDAKGTKEPATAGKGDIPAPIIPKEVPVQRNVAWRSIEDKFVIIRKPLSEKSRKKAACFDVDGTLMVWRTPGSWPSSLSHYELWASLVPKRLRDLYDDGYKLVLISNQGAIQSAHNGKNASRVKNLINWIAHVVDRPVHAVLSTKSLKKEKNSFHKPTSKMWSIAIDFLNKQKLFDIEESFFVGDSADTNDPQGGVDLRFAQSVSQEYGNGKDLKFYTPEEFFGPSDAERRQRSKSLEKSVTPPPKRALQARSALLGGYMEGPILLILCGVQGSGKSTFCQKLLEDGNDHWVHLSQDTINNGKPGKREKVESEAKDALEQGKSVVVDRMHLDEEQRIAKAVRVAAHVIVFNPPRETIAKRVRERKNHPGKVTGESGVRVAMNALNKLILPTYGEDIQLITCATRPSRVSWLARLYKSIAPYASKKEGLPKKLSITNSLDLPTISLGTMGIRKKATKDIVLSVMSEGISSIDTAPTYKNEASIGEALSMMNNDVLCIGKIPKSVVQPEQVRLELESTLKKLQRKHVDVLLLHWPCDVIAARSLADVWKAMEQCLNDGLCKVLGVCNFNASALATLLQSCTIRPVINQIERHVLWPQWDLVDFCERHDIIVQAHSPLGQGRDELLADPAIQNIAKETSMSTAQIAIQWNLQHGVAVTPKCSSLEHAKELLSCDHLSPQQMKTLDSITKAQRFVAPPFMFGQAGYCWAATRPSKC